MSVNMVARFHNNYEKMSNGCWEWRKSKLIAGYGQFTYLGERLAHRVSYVIHTGPITKRMVICHKCDNPSCVNPDHLFLGTTLDNIKDCLAKGRHVSPQSGMTHCRRGHEFNEENTYVSVKSGKKDCRICRALRAKRYKNKVEL